MCVAASGDIITHYRCKCAFLDLCLSLSFLFLSVFGYTVTDSTCIGTSLDLRLSLSLCFSQYSGVLSVISTYINKLVQLTQCVIAVYNLFLYILFCVYTYVTWVVFLSLSLCLWMCVAVSGYIITHCRCKCAFPDPCFSLSFCLNVFIRARLYCDWYT